jgi:sugar phosphate isomerase/epimerase
MNIEERSFEESLTRAGAKIDYIHFADSNRLAPGWGHIDFAGILSVLKKLNYKGPIGIEVLPKPDDYSAAQQAVRYVNKIRKEIGE